ncbi:MAG TPA: class I SAM-dependent methyltransferase [Ktedonobacterales bacterium]|jgi:SAM-dependent methyltransferase|nr:class I SAM-dependent methyltransferase [Ktedonobacterales bacterium]
MSDTRYTEANRATWNLWMTRDTGSDHFKDVERFRATGSGLRPIELAEIGEVADKSLLHLQCNLGSETLSWARLGARVTGIDISDEAISFARRLAEESGLSEQARFIRSDLYTLPEALDETFDHVVASYGALCWAPDLEGWAQVAARYVAPGGALLLVDLHPVGMALDTARDDPSGRSLRINHPYFHTREPQTEQAPGEPAVYAWGYSLGEVITALAATGLRIESLHEHPCAHWRQFPQLIESGDGYWRWPDAANELPLLFSVRATRPG